MRERGDLQCFHEPLMYDYYIHRQVRKMPYFEKQDDHPVSYEAVRDMLLERAETKPVFVKDMSYYVVPQIFNDTDFLKRITHFFLIRDPLASIPSYYKLDNDVTLHEIGLESQWQLYEHLRQLGITAPIVEAEAIRNDPQTIISKLWEAMDLDYCEHAFSWQRRSSGAQNTADIPDAPTVNDWQQVSGWHQSVIASTGIAPLSPDELLNQQKRFDELASESAKIQAFYDHHHPFYANLQSHAL